jgi:hypothetical protein
VVRVRAISGWATGAMCSIAGFALVFLLGAFSPLVEAWAVRDPGARVPMLATRAVGGLLIVGLGLAAMTWLVWSAKAAANVAVLVRKRPAKARPPVRMVRLAASSVGPDNPVRQRRTVRLVWAWGAASLSAVLAFAAGWDAQRANAQELADIRAAMATGDRVDAPLARALFSRELVARLPAAVLVVAAAVLALLVIARVTNAQYTRVVSLTRRRRAHHVPDKPALRATADDWTVVLPAGALVALLSDDAGEHTTVLPAAALDGTIGA